MILKKLIILDYSNEKAETFEFSETSNIICSDSSTTGKSCLIKSIFYTLGFDVKTFPSGWPHKNMLFKLLYTNGSKRGSIIRKNDLFFVDNNKEPMNETDYAKWLLDELHLSIKLPLKVNGDMHYARPSATLLPFYIDQDNSWSGGIYKATTPSLSMYSSQSIPKNIIEYILGIGNDKIVALEEKKQIENKIKDEYAKQVNVLYDLKDKFIYNQQDTISFDVDKIKEEVKKYLYYASKLNEEIKSQKSSIYIKKVKLDALKVDREELNKILRETEHHYKNIECKCTQCGSQLTREQSINRMKLNNNKYEIDCFKLEIDKQIKELENKINSEINELKVNNDNYEKFLNISNEKQGEITLKEYVNNIANTKFTNNYLELRDKIQLAKDICENNIKRLQAEINSLKQQQEIKKENTPERSNEIVSQLKQEQYELNNKLGLLTEADEKFSIAVATILSLGNNAYQIFQSSKVETKREILHLLLSNLKLQDRKISYTLRKPYDYIRSLNKKTPSKKEGVAIGDPNEIRTRVTESRWGHWNKFRKRISDL